MIKAWATPIKKEKTTDLLKGIMRGSKTSFERLDKNETISKEFDIENYDLIVWEIIS